MYRLTELYRSSAGRIKKLVIPGLKIPTSLTVCDWSLKLAVDQCNSPSAGLLDQFFNFYL